MDSRLFGIPTAKKKQPAPHDLFYSQKQCKTRKVKQKYTHNTKTKKVKKEKEKRTHKVEQKKIFIDAVNITKE